jgi:UDP-N-acetylmuramyl pentapeptide phosphotransferase/UDP-N-acetylglucosamine-1-phosphate transferase
MSLYILCFIISACGALFMSRFGSALGFIDHPNERSSHSGLITKAGAVGILTSFIWAAARLNISVFFYLPVSSIAIIGLLSDRRELSPKSRLILQFICAFVLIAAIYSVVSGGFVWVVLTICFAIFIVGTANIYNFMDGINGIAAITGIVGFGLLSVFAFTMSGSTMVGTLALCVAFSCLGFLPFNFPKARVFMGDVGSILLGFLFAGIVVWLSRGILDFICLASFMFPFYADELTTMYLRIRNGEDLTKPHRKHLYQIFANELSVPHWKVSVMYGVAQLVIGVSALLLRPFGVIMVLTLGAYFIVFCLVSFSVRRSV